MNISMYMLHAIFDPTLYKNENDSEHIYSIKTHLYQRQNNNIQ